LAERKDQAFQRLFGALLGMETNNVRELRTFSRHADSRCKIAIRFPEVRFDL
jgi:hypothetical protein